MPRFARRADSSEAEPPRERFEFRDEDVRRSIAHLGNLGKPTPLLLPGGFNVHSARSTGDLQPISVLANQVVSSTSPQSDITDLMTGKVAKGNSGESDSRQLNLPGRVKRVSESENRLFAESAGVNSKHQLFAAEPRDVLCLDHK